MNESNSDTQTAGPKILAVDDEPDLEVLLKQLFRRQIREGKLSFTFAHDGLEAVEKIEAQPDTDVVLTDINMPRMDGLDLLGRIATVSPITRSVVVSAYSDIRNIRTAMNRGAYDFITKPIDFKDLQITLDKTIAEVGKARKTLKALHENDILKMYVDENVLKFMSRQQSQEHLLANEAIDGTVMFIDICDFTTISENFRPDEVVRMLNRLFDVIVPEIIAVGGTVDKFIGDAVMTIFRGEHHIDRALEAALSVRDKLKSLESEPDKTNLPPVRVSIGVDSGEMVSGNIGSESLARLDFTVIGNVVNTAARYESFASHGQIIVGHDVYERISQSFDCEYIDEIKLKNKAAPARLYNVRG